MGSAVLGLAAGWSAGIAIGVLHPLPLLVLVIAVAAAIAATLLAPSVRQKLLAVTLVALLLGMVRVEAGREATPLDPLEAVAGEVVLGGRIVEAPLPRGSRVEAVLEVDSVAGTEPSAALVPLGDAHPRVLLRATYLRAAHGDRIEVRGRLSRPLSRPGWPLEEILARRQIRWVMDAGGARVTERSGPSLVRLLTAARGFFEANTRAALPEPHASLVAGIVFGARVGLPADLRRDMAVTGTSHLTAVSGANVAVVAGALIIAANRIVGRLPASLSAIVGVWLYTLLVGAPPSALRAATMATFALVVYGLGRQSDAIVGLALAVSALLAWDPGLAFDLGFQLSATATAGLILLMPRIERRLHWLPRWARGQVALAVAAQIATLPLIVGTFQRLSLVSLPANLVAAPTIPIIMACGALIAVLGGIPGLDAGLGWPAWVVTGALLTVIETAARLPGGVVGIGQMPGWLPVGWYAVLVCWVAAGSADVKALGVHPGALKVAALVGSGLMAALVVFGWPVGGRQNDVQVVLLDVDPAAAFVRSAGGGTALVRTSTATQGLVASVGSYLELSETGIDVEIGPGGVRTAVSLLDIGVEQQSSDPVDGAAVAASTDDGPDGDDGDTSFEPGPRAPMQIGPGARVDLGERVAVQVVDVRVAGQRQVADLAILVDDVAILLPGPGTPSARWQDVALDAASIARLPASAISWARSLPPRRWLVARQG